MNKLLLATLMAILLAACSSQPTTTDEGAMTEDKGGAAAGAGGASTAGTGTGGVSGTSVPSGGSANPLRDPKNVLSKREVFFDYDSFVVREEFRPMVEAHARYLAGNRNARVALQGHADERGSREYNIALGQKRSDAVKRMMLLLGAQEVQIETVSFGEEKPRNSGHDEAAWAENRRVDIVYAGE